MKPRTKHELQFAKGLHAARKAKGWSQRTLAAQIGLEDSTIGQYETLTRSPRVDIICRLADALGCTADELLGRGESKQ